MALTLRTSLIIVTYHNTSVGTSYFVLALQKTLYFLTVRTLIILAAMILCYYLPPYVIISHPVLSSLTLCYNPPPSVIISHSSLSSIKLCYHITPSATSFRPVTISNPMLSHPILSYHIPLCVIIIWRPLLTYPILYYHFLSSTFISHHLLSCPIFHHCPSWSTKQVD